MVGVLILSHGCLARELLAAARRIAGECERIEALCLDWDEPADKGRDRVVDVLSRLDQGEGVLVLTDLFGGTPHNIAHWLCEESRVALVSGVNLPMVLRLGCSKTGEKSLAELAKSVAERGRVSIRLCGVAPAQEKAACRVARGARG